MAPPLILSPEGLRADGRRSGELRRLKASLGSVTGADGSCAISHGNTALEAAVYGPQEPSGNSGLSGGRRAPVADKRLASLRISLSQSAFSSSSTSHRQSKDRKLMEMELFLEGIFGAVIDRSLHPRSLIDIHIQILQLDGGLLHAAINATTLALIDAGIAMTDYVSACSVGVVGDSDGNLTPLLDVNSLEEGSLPAVLTLAILPRSSKTAFLNVEGRMHKTALEQSISLVTEGCHQTHAELDTLVRTGLTAKYAANS